MIKNTYILHIDEPRSLQYLNECLNSCKQFSNINPIPVQGYKGANYKQICEDFGIGIIPFYVDQMNTNGNVLDRAFSCSGGHFKIWQMIVKSRQPGVVLEHDAIVKGDYTKLEPRDGEILWLGPRINLESDYQYPWGVETTYIDINRFEGTHAYCITPATAQYLLNCIKDVGLNDSIDGQLGMRNMFDIAMRTVDPPPVVAVVGNRSSLIENSGNPGFWNSIHTPNFLSNLKPGCVVPPVRQLAFTNQSFLKQAQALDAVFKQHGKLNNKEQAVLVIGGYEGLSSLWLSNKLLRHDNSFMQIVSQFRNTTEHNMGLWPQENLERILRFNTYFSKYYYKINVVPVASDNDLLAQAVHDPEIKFDVIYCDGNHEFKDVLYDGILSWNLLSDDGILIFDDVDLESVNKCVSVIYDTVRAKLVYRDDNIVALKKERD